MKRHTLFCLLMAGMLAGCESGSDADNGNGEGNDSGALGAVEGDSAAVAAPAQRAPAHVWPEDEVRDAAREAPVRERAGALAAIRPEDTSRLKVGDEVIVLVRGNVRAGTIYGSSPYTLDSRLRTAVVHAGVLADGELGVVRMKVIAHDGEHPSVERNGVRPNAWGQYAPSYVIERVD